ncbi:MAG: peptidase S11 D-alanyl-D-alanine carboxypeptidase 1, partial [Microgenomates group bacterium Gr01-1014_93]
MKHYFLSAFLILIAVIALLLVPIITSSTKNILVSAEVKIPENNTSILAIQKYNRSPISSNLPIQNFSARAVLVKDLNTNTILFQKDSDNPLPIASTTKIMSALVAASYFKPNSVLVVGNSALVPGSRVGLNPGESLSFRSLLYGMLLNSGNDAAFTIAENYPGGVDKFVEAMNQKAKDLNLINTHFDNPAGFDSPNHFSSASDLSIITEEALKNGD